jgi:glycerophosphoryl diester phosphodiesterase
MAAFQMAIDMGCHGLECDVRESRDGELVIFHDETIKRLTGRPGSIGQLTLRQIKDLEVGAWFASDFSGQGIPSLIEFLDALPSSILINLEIKAASAEKIIRIIQKRELTDQVILSSFDQAILFEIKRLAPTLSVGYLVNREPWKKVFPEAIALGAFSLNIPSRRATDAVVARAHEASLEVYIYTVDDPTEMARFVTMETDGLFTNYPDRLSQLQHRE